MPNYIKELQLLPVVSQNYNYMRPKLIICVLGFVLFDGVYLIDACRCEVRDIVNYFIASIASIPL